MPAKAVGLSGSDISAKADTRLLSLTRLRCAGIKVSAKADDFFIKNIFHSFNGTKVVYTVPCPKILCAKRY